MSLKLYYFDGRGIAEPIRWILAFGEIEYEDVRFPFEKLPPDPLSPEMKARCRWGQVPLVEFEGKSLTQSTAIMRFFANKTGLVPQDPFNAALCDEYVDTARDMINAMYMTLFLPATGVVDSPEKQAIENFRETQKRRFDVYESIIASNDGKHLVGNSLTWADVILACMLKSCSNFTRSMPYRRCEASLCKETVEKC